MILFGARFTTEIPRVDIVRVECSSPLPTIASAIEIATYFIPHAETVLTMMEAKEAPGDDSEWIP